MDRMCHLVSTSMWSIQRQVRNLKLVKITISISFLQRLRKMGRPEKAVPPSACEFKMAGGVQCGRPAPWRVIIESVNINNFHDRRNWSDRYLCKDHKAD